MVAKTTRVQDHQLIGTEIQKEKLERKSKDIATRVSILGKGHTQSYESLDGNGEPNPFWAATYQYVH